MPEPQGDTSPVNNGVVPRQIRFCRWLWKHPLPFLVSTLIINVIINIGSTWLITPAKTTAIPDTSIIGSIFGWVSTHWLLSILLGMISALLLLLTWQGSRWPVQQTVSLSPTQQDRVHMIGRLRRSYNDLLAQTLQGIAWMDIKFSNKSDAVRNAVTFLLRLENQPEHQLPVGTSILDAYDQAEHDLLILGAPGSGKSTQLLELARQLVERAAQDVGQPLPVILPLSSWAVKCPSLSDWIVEQLIQTYGISQWLSEQWVQEGAILPLLDGLDEMDEVALSACINEINTYHQIHFGVPLVICSRTAEYNAAAEHLRLVLQEAVIVQPLTFQQIDAYLLQATKPIAALRSVIKKNHALQELATTPLMLSVLMLTYQGATVRKLPNKGALLQQQVWADYVTRMVQQKGAERTVVGQDQPVKRYTLEQTHHWLTWLALQMRVHLQTIFYAEYMQNDWLTNKQRVGMWLLVRLPAVLLGVLTSLLLSFFFVYTTDSLILLHIGFLGGFLGWCLSQNQQGGKGIGSLARSRKHLPRLLGALLFGFLVTASDLSPFTNDNVIGWLGDGLCLSISAWLLQGVFARIKSSSHYIPAQSMNSWFHPFGWIRTIPGRQAIQAGVILGIGISLTSGLLFQIINDIRAYGLSFELLFQIINSLNNGIRLELSNGLSNGLSDGLIIGGTTFLVSITLDAQIQGVRLAERIHWTSYMFKQTHHLWTSLIFALISCCLLGLSLGLDVGFSDGLRFGLGEGLSLGLCYWIIVGLYKGVKQTSLEDQDRRQFNQGLRHSLRNGMILSLLSAGIITINVIGLRYGLSLGLSNILFIGSDNIGFMGLGNALSFGLSQGLSLELSLGWLVILCGWLVVWAATGGLTILRHYLLRMLLAQSRTFPWRAQAFLDDATARILLQRVGGGYRFMHRLLLDYFADLETAPPSATSPISPPVQQPPSP